MANAPRLSPIRVTRMEMTEAPAGNALSPPAAGLRIVPLAPDVDAYLALYRNIGEPHGWDMRYRLLRETLAATLAGPSALVLAIEEGAAQIGFIEFEVKGREAELLHFGVLPRCQGRGFGPWLLDQGLRAAWSQGIERIWLHTDDWDHHKARGTYLRAGFHIFFDGMEDPTDI